MSTLHKKMKNILLILNTIIILIGLGVFVYFRFFDGGFQPIVEVENLETTKNIYKYGDTLQIKSTYCRTSDLRAKIQWSLIDHIVILFPEKIKDLPKGCFVDKITDIQVITNAIQPGSYYLEADVYYTVNPLRVIEYKFRTNQFIIIK